MRFTLHGARLVDATTDIASGDITIHGDRIENVGEVQNTAQRIVDATDAIVMPGFIEVHTHGGGNHSLHTTDVQEIRAYLRWIPGTGVTSFLIGVLGTPYAMPEPQLVTSVEAIESYGNTLGAEPLGIHLEGPYISEKRRGAHAPSWLRKPNEAEIERIIALTKGYLRLITVAPELPGAPLMIRRLVEAGVTVSIGHSDADYEQTREALQLGITHATHCFNAMRSLHHRAPGPIPAIAQAEQVLGELIADGVHVHPAMMDILVRILGPERTIIVTDALEAAGMPDATFELAGQQVHVACGAARLADGTLTGSILTMDQALRNVLVMTRVSMSEAVGMLTLNPARSARVADRKGRLQADYDADILIFDASLKLQATICRGQIAFANEVWRPKLSSLESAD